jgi:hypothetical protein
LLVFTKSKKALTMSVRAIPVDARATHANQLRADIENFRATTVAAAAPGSEVTFDSLSEAEKSAATIGVSPDEWKPIGFMNQAHYTMLLKKNALGGRLTQQSLVKRILGNTAWKKIPEAPFCTHPHKENRLILTISPFFDHFRQQIEAFKHVASQ